MRRIKPRKTRDKPLPLLNEECSGCLETARLLMPVEFSYAPYWDWEWLCLNCRLNIDRHDPYCGYGYDWKHSKHKRQREAYIQWPGAYEYWLDNLSPHKKAEIELTGSTPGQGQK